MKKFYYKKHVSLDKTPIILRLERRHTVNMTKDEKGKDRLSTRATSISSIDQLKYDPPVSKSRTRQVAKSLSEDVLSSSSSGYSPASAVVITEAELSSSWLYKSMKAASNSEDEHEKQTANAPVPAKNDLTPKVLQDPSMKPVPVPLAARSKKTSSCWCYLAIMLVISICTIGFLSMIGGIVYMEIFSKNVTSDTIDESMDVLSPLHDAQKQDLVEPMHVDYVESAKLVQEVLKYETGNKNSSNETDLPRIVHVLDFGKPLGTELSQYIDNSRTEVEFRHKDLVIYEEKSSSLIAKEETFNVSRSKQNEQHELEKDEDTKGSSFENDITNENEEEMAKGNTGGKSEKPVMHTSSQFNQYGDNVSTENKKEEIYFNQLDTVSHFEMKEKTKEAQTEFEMKSEAILYQSPKHEELDQLVKPGTLDTEVYDSVSKGGNEMDSEIIVDGKKLDDFSESLSEQILEHADKSVTEFTAEDSEPTDKGGHDFSDKSNVHEPMITTIKESNIDNFVEESPISRRDGDINLSIHETPDFKIKPSVRTGFKRPAFSSVRFRKQQIPSNLLVKKKPVSMTVSLTEAMKHLKVLDVSNKFPLSRGKSVKPKVKSIKKQTGRNPQRKKNGTQERSRYLQKMRSLLYKNLQ